MIAPTVKYKKYTYLDVGVGRRHVRRGGRVAGRLGQVRGRDQLAEQHRAAGRGHGLVQRLQLLQDVIEVEQALP